MKSPAKYIRRAANHGNPCWIADLPPTFTGNRRVRRFFQSKGDAEHFVMSYHGDLRAFGEEPAAWFHQLTPARRAKLLLCLQRLDAIGTSLEDAVRLAEEHGGRPASVPVADVAKEFLAEKASRDVASDICGRFAERCSDPLQIAGKPRFPRFHPVISGRS